LELSTGFNRITSLQTRVSNVSGCLLPPGIYTTTFMGTYTIRPDTIRASTPTVTVS
jgi:hypothetical protein